MSAARDDEAIMAKQVQLAVALALALVAVAVPTARAQDPQPAPGGRGRAAQGRGGLNVAEVERLFDGYVAMQAQDALKLTDAQFPQFLARLKMLQQTRRQHLAARRALVAELNGGLKTSPPAEGALADGLKKLRDLDGRYADDLRRSYEGIDQVLDVSQQARFRVFEETVERRKFDLMLRARRSAQQGEPGRQR
jgi:hypothetical protein